MYRQHLASPADAELYVDRDDISEMRSSAYEGRELPLVAVKMRVVETGELCTAANVT